MLRYLSFGLVFVSACLCLPAPSDASTVAEAKQLPDFTTVSISGKVTLTGTNYFYVQDNTGYIGIRVEKSNHTLTAGKKADVVGQLRTNANKERYISATTATPGASVTVRVMNLINRDVGGVDWHYSMQNGSGQRGVYGGVGLNNIGLYVRTTGKVTVIDTTSFSIDDGSGHEIKCQMVSGTVDAGWRDIAVSGVVSIYRVNSSIYPPVILCSKVEDLRADLERLTLPDPPFGNANPLFGLSDDYTAGESLSSLNHPVEYSIDWGDGTTTGWSTTLMQQKKWATGGTLYVKTRARCKLHNEITAESEPLAVFVEPHSEMITIPGGSFQMGNTGSEGYTFANELPQHTVQVSQFTIGKYEVTRKMYKRFMDDNGYFTQSLWSTAGWTWKQQNNRTKPGYWDDTSLGGETFTQTENHPVVGISYYEAEAFCKWAEGRLPTEAEWEKAARKDGSLMRIWPWGQSWQAEYCNTFYDTNPVGGAAGSWRTTPVGSYTGGVNAYGLHDTAGNVFEWCSDWYSATYYSETPQNGWSNPTGPTTGTSKTIRGGAWNSNASGVRCSYRGAGDPASTWFHFGFRLAR